MSVFSFPGVTFFFFFFLCFTLEIRCGTLKISFSRIFQNEPDDDALAWSSRTMCISVVRDTGWRWMIFLLASFAVILFLYILWYIMSMSCSLVYLSQAQLRKRFSWDFFLCCVPMSSKKDRMETQRKKNRQKKKKIQNAICMHGPAPTERISFFAIAPWISNTLLLCF